jgi:hypothetical protein
MTTRISFKAGRCTRIGSSKRVQPDPRRGTLSLEQRDDDLLHFCWRERGQAVTEEAEEYLIIFPEDATFSHVALEHMTLVKEGEDNSDNVEVTEDERKKNTRIYALKFKSSDQISFFWMQGADESKDADQVAQVNALIGEEQAEEGDRMET